MIRTVLGDIPAAALGVTLMHEHILCDIRPPALRGMPMAPITMADRYDIDYGRIPNATKSLLDDRDLATAEVAAFAADGGQAMVELTIGGLSPDPRGLQAVSRATGVHIVMGCGHYVEAFHDPANATRSVEDFAAEMVAAIRTGAFGTDIRAGIIGEIGCTETWTAQEQRVMAGAVLAQQETGAALTIHPGAVPEAPFEILAFLRAHGADLRRTIMGHVDRTLFDEASILALAESGMVLEFDLFGFESAYWSFAPIMMPNDGQRLRLIRALIDRGHLDQVAISHDICRLTRLLAYGGHGYGHLLRNVRPFALAQGFDAAEWNAMLAATPARLLSLPE